MTITPEELSTNPKYHPDATAIHKLSLCVAVIFKDLSTLAKAINRGNNLNCTYRNWTKAIVRDFDYLQFHDQLNKACSAYDEAEKLVGEETGIQ